MLSCFIYSSLSFSTTCLQRFQVRISWCEWKEICCSIQEIKWISFVLPCRWYLNTINKSDAKVNLRSELGFKCWLVRRHIIVESGYVGGHSGVVFCGKWTTAGHLWPKQIDKPVRRKARWSVKRVSIVLPYPHPSSPVKHWGYTFIDLTTPFQLYVAFIFHLFVSVLGLQSNIQHVSW